MNQAAGINRSNEDVLQSATVAFIYISLNKSLVLEEIRGEVEQLLAYAEADLKGKPLATILSDQQQLKYFSVQDAITQNHPIVLRDKKGVKKKFLASFLSSSPDFNSFLLHPLKQERPANITDKKFTALFESAIDGIILMSERGIIENVNPAVSKLFGYTFKELNGKNVSILMPNPDRDAHDSYLQNYHQSGVKKIIGIGRDVQGRKKDGTIFPIRLSVSEIFINDERIYMGMLHDMTNQILAQRRIEEYTLELKHTVRKRTKQLRETNKQLELEIAERKQIEEALIQGQRLYREIARNFPDGTISVLDRELKYVFIDGKELFELGLKSDSLIGTKIVDRLPRNLALRLTSILENVFENRKETIEIEINQQVYLITAVPLLNAFGMVEQILVVEENITNLKQAERKIRLALKKEKELNNLKSRFVSMASHEFRTPLSTILTSTSLVEKHLGTKGSESIHKHLDRIKSSVSNLTQILNEFLTLSKLEDASLAIRLYRRILNL